MRSIKVMSALLLILHLVGGALASGDDLVRRSSDHYDPPAPRLQYPVTDQVILTGKAYLEFQWWNDLMGVSQYIFRIYKGYNMYESGLIHKQTLSANESSVKIRSGLFEDSQVYTWSLIQVSFSGAKSDKSFNSFKVIKKSD